MNLSAISPICVVFMFITIASFIQFNSASKKITMLALKRRILPSRMSQPRLIMATAASTTSSFSRGNLTKFSSRFGDSDNLVGSWQAKGQHYVSFDNLKNLNDQLTDYNSNRSRYEKEILLKDITLTYFGRFQNLIREEYQYEKRIIEER
jgi:hypothetical protein